VGEVRLLSAPQARSLPCRMALLGLFLAAWGILLYRLNDVPPGFQHDQTFNTMDAIDVLSGRHTIYFPANFGREPIGIYSAAGVFMITGGHYAWGLRFSSVFWAMLGLATTVAFARRYLSRGAALLAAALMAGSFWFLFAARLGLEPMALLPLAVAMLYLLARGLAPLGGACGVERRSFADFAWAGLAGGLAVYTYLAARSLFLLPILLLVYEIFAARLGRRRYGGGPACLAGARRTQAAPTNLHALKARMAGLLLAFGIMLAASAPLLAYLRDHASTSDRRVAELGAPIAAALRGDLGPLGDKSWEAVRSLLWAGPPAIPYHYNVPGRPALQPVLALLFLAGLVATFARWRRREFLLMAALVLGMAPVLLTGADALYMRGIIALPLLFILVARGVWAVGLLAGSMVSRAAGPGPASSRAWGDAATLLAAVAVLGLLAWHGRESSIAYFRTWARAEETGRIYNADFRAAAAFVSANPSAGQVFIGTDRLLDLDAKTYRLYEPRQGNARWFYLPGNPPLPSLTGGQALYLLPSNVQVLPAALALLAANGGQEFTVPAANAGAPLLRGLRVDRQTVDRALALLGVRPLDTPAIYGDTVRLDAIGAQDQGSRLDVASRWQALGPWPFTPAPGMPPQPPKLALSLTDATGYKWAQADLPAAMPYRTWQSGDEVLEISSLPLPADLLPGSYEFRLALYDDAGGALPVRRGDALASTAPVVAMLDVSTAPSRGEPPAPPYPVGETVTGDELRLSGAWDPPATLVAGVPAQIHVSWRTGSPGVALDTAGLSFWLRALDDAGVVLWEQDAAPLQRLPPLWPAGQTYRLVHPVEPPLSVRATAAARLEICALQGAKALACGLVGWPEIIVHPPLSALPATPEHPVDVSFGGQLSLVGYDLARAGSAYALTLYWQVKAPPPAELRRFVHGVAVPAGEQIVVQADGTPENGGIPMPYWRPGEYIVDRVTLEPPAGQDVLRFYVGWYDPETGLRLPARLPSGEELPDQRLAIPVPLRRVT